MLYLTTGLLQI